MDQSTSSLTRYQKQIDEFTTGMAKTLNDPTAQAARKAGGMSDAQARIVIREQRRVVGLPPLADL